MLKDNLASGILAKAARLLNNEGKPCQAYLSTFNRTVNLLAAVLEKKC